MVLISLTDVSKETKKALLKELGYSSDEQFVLDPEGNHLKDKYTGEDIRLSNMLILPGSTLILDNNPLSVASYLEEYGDERLC